jgi:hypothetical protein
LASTDMKPPVAQKTERLGSITRMFCGATAAMPHRHDRVAQKMAP